MHEPHVAEDIFRQMLQRSRRDRAARTTACAKRTASQRTGAGVTGDHDGERRYVHGAISSSTAPTKAI